MHLRQTFYASFLILAVFLFVSGCISSMGMKNATANALQVVTTPVPPPLITTTSTVPSPARTSCSASERREYRVIQGDPFTYEGTIPDNANLSVEVSVYSELEPGPSGSSMPVPVNANGTFLVAISGNQTGLDWENYLVPCRMGMATVLMTMCASDIRQGQIVLISCSFRTRRILQP